MGDEMTEELERKRVRKGEIARERILECALRLFGSKGYEETTMREIAEAAGCSPGLAYRYFASKEEMVLVLYQNLSEELKVQTRDLPAGPLAERFQTVVTRHFALMAPYRDVFSSLFGTALNPRSKAGVFGESTADVRRQCRGIHLRVIQGAKDAPRTSQREDLATVFYGAHLALVLFWLIDQSRNTARTQRFLVLLRDMLKLIQPVLWLPPVAQALARLAAIIGPLLGDERHQDEDHANSEVSL
jgi:AcrR family transcriptional regulator